MKSTIDFMVDWVQWDSFSLFHALYLV